MDPQLNTPCSNDSPSSGGRVLYLCRGGYEKILTGEIDAWLKKSGLTFDIRKNSTAGEGMVLLSPMSAGQIQCLADHEFIFERQRMLEADSIDVGSIKTCAQSIIQRQFPLVDQSDLPWTCHTFTPDMEGAKPLRPRVKNIEKALMEKLKKRFGRMHRRYQPSNQLAGQTHFLIVQICMNDPDHVYASVNPSSSHIHPHPGGEQRMRFDSRSPSRSYLKLYEAVSHLREKPQPGQRAVDLGAAPGGWTYFLLKQGCRVTAIDNAALKLENPAQLPGFLEHIQADGFRFSPSKEEAPFDWLCCDMLRPPRQVMDLLLKWIDNRWMRFFVVNLKLPQKNPLRFVEELEDNLADQRLACHKIKQLYHDRDEITVMGII